MFLPLLGVALVLSSESYFDLTKASISETTIALLNDLGIVLGISLIVLLGVFLLLMNKEVSSTGT